MADRSGGDCAIHCVAAVGGDAFHLAAVGIQRGVLPLHPVHRRAHHQRDDADTARSTVLGLDVFDPGLSAVGLAWLVLLLLGKRVATALEYAEWFMIAWIILALLFLGIFFTSGLTWLTVISGFFAGG